MHNNLMIHLEGGFQVHVWSDSVYVIGIIYLYFFGDRDAIDKMLIFGLESNLRWVLIFLW